MNKAFKKKMRTRKLKFILVPLVSILFIINLIVTVAHTTLESTLNTFLGKGKTVLHVPKENKLVNSNYYDLLFKDGSEAIENSYRVSNEIGKEGSVLLKNNGILPLSKGSRITPFGRGFLEPVYGQLNSGGSAKWVINPITPKQGLSKFLNVNLSVINKLEALPPPKGLVEAENTTSASTAGSILGGNSLIYEYNPEIYNDIDNFPEETGIVFISRTGQEGSDKKYDSYIDGTPHYLALSKNEKGAIKAAKSKCKSVIIVIVSSAPMELTPLLTGELEADAILWMGHPGERGFSILSDILCGEVNPSGRTVDTFASDFTKDPSYANFGSFEYNNKKIDVSGFEVSGSINKQFNDYQEDVYVGYRYYETASDIDPLFNYGEIDTNGALIIEGAVCYPFGYGLSYTTFKQNIVNFTDSGNNIEVEIKVENTGTEFSGKEVVQLYYTPPYTELDKKLKIEKPTVNLVGFSKTKLLAPGESEILYIVFSKEDMASYCYTREMVMVTTGSYMLEEGEYSISLRKNSHHIIDSMVTKIERTIWYDGNTVESIRQSDIKAQSAINENGEALPYTQANEKDKLGNYMAATNQFQVSSDYMNKNSTILSRSNWINTFPKTVIGRTKSLNDEFIDKLGYETNFDVFTDKKLGNVEGSNVFKKDPPTSKANNGLSITDMRGKSYYHKDWVTLLDQIDWDKDKDGILTSFTGAAYVLGKIDSIGLPESIQEDGANGLKVQGNDNGYDMTKSSSFGFPPLMAATWNTDLWYKIGESFGQEALFTGITGWYCPAVNIHRSPFAGRVFEYYSEDPLLSGKVASAVISGAGDQGLVTYIKHFALNETETNRASLSSSWATEQAMREIYLKPFEIAFKEAKMNVKFTNDKGEISTKVMRAATATMPAQNGVGTLLGTVNDSLLKNVLRDEWGFQGMVISDYWVWNDNNFRDLSLRSGTDAYLCMYMPLMWGLNDYDSPTARWVMRNAIHNIAYTITNSNKLQGAAPGTVFKTSIATWKVLFITINILLYIFIGWLIVFMIKRGKDEKLNPEKFKKKNKLQ